MTDKDTRGHKREIELPVTAERAFSALIKPTAICDWWQASSAIVLAEEGGFWTATWGAVDDPDYITWHRITEYEFPRLIELGDARYYTRFEPPPFEFKMVTRFEVEPVGTERALLRVIQTGFPADRVADEFYEACDKGWSDTFDGIVRHFDALTKAK